MFHNLIITYTLEVFVSCVFQQTWPCRPSERTPYTIEWNSLLIYEQWPRSRCLTSSLVPPHVTCPPVYAVIGFLSHRANVVSIIQCHHCNMLFSCWLGREIMQANPLQRVQSSASSYISVCYSHGARDVESLVILLDFHSLPHKPLQLGLHPSHLRCEMALMCCNYSCWW